MTRAVLFDADGVLTLPEEFFSAVYARSRGLNPERFEEFFKGPFQLALIGKADLKELIANNQSLWQWEGDVDELLKLWFKTEDVRNETLLEVVLDTKSKGMPCFLATNQEKYRGQYMREVMFKGIFDDYFISADIGATKPNVQFFELVVASIKERLGAIKPEEIIYFDDTQSHIDGAKEAGIDAHLYESVEQVKSLLQGSTTSL